MYSAFTAKSRIHIASYFYAPYDPRRQALQLPIGPERNRFLFFLLTIDIKNKKGNMVAAKKRVFPSRMLGTTAKTKKEELNFHYYYYSEISKGRECAYSIEFLSLMTVFQSNFFSFFYWGNYIKLLKARFYHSAITLEGCKVQKQYWKHFFVILFISSGSITGCKSFRAKEVKC